jgi:hypothetical protein
MSAEQDRLKDLHWHALNYRTAATQHAEYYWQALLKHVNDAVAAAPPALSVEPVAWLYKARPETVFDAGTLTTSIEHQPENSYWEIVGPLYAHPAPSVEPVAWVSPEYFTAFSRQGFSVATHKVAPELVPLYASPPDHRAAMRQALDALDSCHAADPYSSGSNAKFDEDAVKQAATALRAALGGDA